MSHRFLPPLEAGTGYRVSEFEDFEYAHKSLRDALLGEEQGILHLHLKNKTTLDLPVSDAQLERLLGVLIHAMPQKAIELVKEHPAYDASS